jgi:hypothetical protein
MDYLCFAIYTITTTGYGDIKPMTPYTKFLCTIANMTEGFFIVVFFNTVIAEATQMEGRFAGVFLTSDWRVVTDSCARVGSRLARLLHGFGRGRGCGERCRRS